MEKLNEEGWKEMTRKVFGEIQKPKETKWKEQYQKLAESLEETEGVESKFHFLIRNGCENAIKKILNEKNCPAELKYKNGGNLRFDAILPPERELGRNTLYLSAYYGHEHLVRLFYNLGVDPVLPVSLGDYQNTPNLLHLVGALTTSVHAAAHSGSLCTYILI